MKVLFMPCHIGGYAHIIPLIILSKMLDTSEYEKMFFLSKHAKNAYGSFYQKYNIKVADVDDDGTTLSAIKVYEMFKPDVIVDDFSYTAGFLRQINAIPRVTILRTGSFPHEKKIKGNFKHSSGLDNSKLPKKLPGGLKAPKSIADLFEAEVKVIPGIPSIEVLPSQIQGDTTYLFCGPLYLKDIIVPDELKLFFHKNKKRRKVYLTYGSAQKPPDEIKTFLKNIVEQGGAITTNVEFEKVANLYPETFYYDGYLPMHYVCSNVDLVIHHCGSATYHYPIIHLKNTITIGTGCYDREIIALRLEELQLTQHVPSPDQAVNFVKELGTVFKKNINEDKRLQINRIRRQKTFFSQIEYTRQRFNFKDALTKATSSIEANLCR